MKEEKSYLIGVFSDKTGLSIRTLHYYDEIGLLKPNKLQGSGHRIYNDSDVLRLQRIVGLKFLGYSLEEIKSMIDKDSFDLSLKDTLALQQRALEDKKEQIESTLTAIRRTIALLEESGTVDSDFLMSIIKSIQSEKEQREWLEKHLPTEGVNSLFNKSEEEWIDFDKQNIELSNETRRLAGRAADDPEVQALIEKFMQFNLEFVGEDVMNSFGLLDSIDPKEIERMTPSPFTQEEEDWLNSAMEYYMRSRGMLDD